MNLDETLAAMRLRWAGTAVSSGGSVASRARFVRRIGASLPRAWVPAALRGLSGASACLPAGMRYRLGRVLGLSGRDMGDIDREYAAWIALHERIDQDTRRGIMAVIAAMIDPPLISVLMPVFDPSPVNLQAAIRSVTDQFYPWWELCVCDDASRDPAITALLRDAAAADHRIKLVRHPQNGHISAASNSALGLATGTFVALLDHDDILPPHALYEVAARIVAQPDVDIIYSDEDHIDDNGRRSHPYFKSDWNPELMLGQNLISHLGVYRRALIERINGFRTGFEGSQDYDLALRIVAETHADRIVHIPKVLYHWRQAARGRTFSEKAHDRCVQNGRRAIREFVNHAAPDAKVVPAPLIPLWTRVIYPVPEPAPLVSVIISGIGSTDSLSQCIDGLLNRTDYPAMEILIPADAGSTGVPPRDRRVRYIGELGPNEAAEAARGSLVLMMECLLCPCDAGWLREMVSHAIRPGVGAVGAKLLGPEGKVEHAGIAVGGRGVVFRPFVGRARTRTGYFGQLQLVRGVTAVSSACMLIDRTVFLAAGGRDDGLSLALFGDIDFCLKLSGMGYRVVWTPYAELMLRGRAAGQCILPGLLQREAALMRARWGNTLDADRFWSSNLSCESSEVALAFPPRIVGKTAD